MRQLTKSDADEIECRSRNTTGRKVQTFIVTVARTTKQIKHYTTTEKLNLFAVRVPKRMACYRL